MKAHSRASPKASRGLEVRMEQICRMLSSPRPMHNHMIRLGY